ncbi:MAG TPA: sodium/substrate symporter small subunit [Noviherbaspirillum sp.]|nr:sodium/substrate symporter small subunit [Noviherbaspirillum sp.]
METMRESAKGNLPGTRYWRAARRATAALLLAWFGVTFVTLFFARELADLRIFGWPFSFYMAAQGLILFYLLLVALYVGLMRRLDRMLKDDHAA